MTMVQAAITLRYRVVSSRGEDGVKQLDEDFVYNSHHCMLWRRSN